MKRRRGLKVKRIVIILVILIIISLIILSPFMFIDIKLIGNKKIQLDYGEKYSEPGFKAYMFNKEITDEIKVKNNIKQNIGNYEVSYSYKFLIQEMNLIFCYNRE